jgi:hypothetical protein
MINIYYYIYTIFSANILLNGKEYKYVRIKSYIQTWNVYLCPHWNMHKF